MFKVCIRALKSTQRDDINEWIDVLPGSNSRSKFGLREAEIPLKMEVSGREVWTAFCV